MPGVLGKSFLLEACVWKFLDMKLAVLIACPTGYLASRYRSIFGDSVECDTVHSAFMFPVFQQEHPRINWELSMYNFILVDEVYTLSTLTMLNFKFDIITISETKIQESTEPTFDVTLQNYNLYQTSTESTSGGTLIYVSKKLNSKIRNDIKIYKPKELESTFIEITNPRKKTP